MINNIVNTYHNHQFDIHIKKLAGLIKSCQFETFLRQKAQKCFVLVAMQQIVVLVTQYPQL